MRLCTFFAPVTLIASVAFLAMPGGVSSQEPGSSAAVGYADELPEAPAPRFAIAAGEAPGQQALGTLAAQAPEATWQAPSFAPASKSKQQSRGILGMVSSYRVVNAGETPPPPTPRLAFKIATHSSFDPSSFALTGVTSLMSEGLDTNPQFGKGVAGFGRYYWRGCLDKANGNYLVIFALPTLFHQDERYFIKGSRSILQRSIYASSRVLITRDYHGNNGFNTSEMLGRGIAEGISLSYYPSKDRSFESISGMYAYALGRDAATNIFREFWPGIAARLGRRHE